MERTKKASAPVEAVQETVVTPRKVEKVAQGEKKVRWTNNGGVFYMKDGRVIQREETFMARPSEVPKAFRDIIKPMEPIVEQEPFVEAVDSAFTLRARPGGSGLFDIVAGGGKVINERPLTEDDAKEIMAKLG